MTDLTSGTVRKKQATRAFGYTGCWNDGEVQGALQAVAAGQRCSARVETPTGLPVASYDDEAASRALTSS